MFSDHFFHQVSLTQQAFLITPLHDSCPKIGKNDYPKKVVLYIGSYVKLLHHLPVKDQCLQQVRCNKRKISVSVVSQNCASSIYKLIV